MKKLKKDNKKYLIYGGISLVILLVILVIFMNGSSQQDSKNIDPKTLSEKEKYALFEADVTCSLANSKSADDVWMAITEIGRIAEKYEYTGQDIENMKTKYTEDLEFQTMALDYIRNMCPEVLEQITG